MPSSRGNHGSLIKRVIADYLKTKSLRKSLLCCNNLWRLLQGNVNVKPEFWKYFSAQIIKNKIYDWRYTGYKSDFLRNCNLNVKHGKERTLISLRRCCNLKMQNMNVEESTTEWWIYQTWRLTSKRICAKWKCWNRNMKANIRNMSEMGVIA